MVKEDELIHVQSFDRFLLQKFNENKTNQQKTVFFVLPGVSRRDALSVPGSAGSAGFEPSIDSSPMSLLASPSDDSSSTSAAVGVTAGDGVVDRGATVGCSTIRLGRIPLRLFKHFEIP